MNAEYEKLREVIAQFQQKRDFLDRKIKELESVLSSLETQNSDERAIVAATTATKSQLSYVQLAIQVLEELGRPTPITVLLERIRERKHDPTITRGSVEATLLRYLTTKGEDTEVVKPRPGTYALRTMARHG
jgi:cell division septum initiation protein DivIVA